MPSPGQENVKAIMTCIFSKFQKFVFSQQVKGKNLGVITAQKKVAASRKEVTV
jgi:hypothetical protein